MKVLIINDIYGKIGGVNTAITNQIKSLEEIKFNILSLGNKKFNENNIKVIKESRIKVLRYLQGIFIFPKAYFSIKKYIKKINPDIIHLHNIDRYPLTILLACKNKKVVRTIHDYGVICPTMWCVKKNTLKVCEGGIGPKCYKNCISFWKYLIYKIIFLKNPLQKKIVNKFISPSKTLKKYLVKHKFKNVNYVPLFVKLPEAKKVKKKKNSLLFVGSLTKQKGIGLLIKSIPYIKKKIPDIKLHIVGEGEEKEKIEQFIKQNKISDNIIMHGKMKHSKLSRLYAESSLFVMPSVWLEQFGLVGIESILCGTSVITTSRGGIVEWLDEGNNGFFFRDIKPKIIADDIINAIRHNIPAHKLKKNQEKIKKEYNKENYKNNMQKIYKELI